MSNSLSEITQGSVVSFSECSIPMRWQNCNGGNFLFSFVQIYYTTGITEPNSSPQPCMVKVDVEVFEGRKFSWVVSPKMMSATTIQQQFYEVFIDPGREKEFNYQLRKALSQIIIERPFSLLEEQYSAGAIPLDKALPGIYLQRSGWQRLPDGQMVFVAGDRVIGDCHIEIIINEEISKVHLPLLADVSLNDVLRSLIQGLFQNPAVNLVVWAYTLLTSIQSLILLAAIPLQCVLFVFGEYGLGKSTALKNLFSLYEYRSNPGHQALFFDAGSSMPALRRALSLFQDLPITVDDLCKASDQETQRLRKKLGGQLIRDGANKVDVTKMHGCKSEEYRVMAGVAISSEFTMETASELTRTIPIHIKNRESDSINKIRQHTSSTLYHFLNWIAPQADILVGELELAYQWSQEEISSGKHSRVLTSEFALDWTFHLFCRFCEDYVNASEATRIYQSYRSAIKEHIQELFQQVEKADASVKHGNIAWHIVQGIESGKLTLCEKEKKLARSDGMKKSGKLYFWPNAISQWITQQNGYKDYSKIRISKELKSDNILILEYEAASDNTVHLEISMKGIDFFVWIINSYTKQQKNFDGRQ